MYEIPTADFYKDIAPDVDQKFDTSNFEKDHISGTASVENKKEIGYSFKFDEKEEKKCKGVRGLK